MTVPGPQRASNPNSPIVQMGPPPGYEEPEGVEHIHAMPPPTGPNQMFQVEATAELDVQPPKDDK